MAGTTVYRTNDSAPDSTTRETTVQLNKAITDIETLRAALALANTKVNALITAAATNIAAVAAVPALVTTTVDAAGDMTAAKIYDRNTAAEITV